MLTLINNLLHNILPSPPGSQPSPPPWPPPWKPPWEATQLVDHALMAKSLKPTVWTSTAYCPYQRKTVGSCHITPFRDITGMLELNPPRFVSKIAGCGTVSRQELRWWRDDDPHYASSSQLRQQQCQYGWTPARHYLHSATF